MVRKTLHSPFLTSVPRNSDLANKPEVDDTFILPEDVVPAPKREIPAGNFDKFSFFGGGGWGECINSSHPTLRVLALSSQLHSLLITFQDPCVSHPAPSSAWLNTAQG